MSVTYEVMSLAVAFLWQPSVSVPTGRVVGAQYFSAIKTRVGPCLPSSRLACHTVRKDGSLAAEPFRLEKGRLGCPVLWLLCSSFPSKEW